jgi:hypothetical protein
MIRKRDQRRVHPEAPRRIAGLAIAVGGGAGAQVSLRSWLR